MRRAIFVLGLIVMVTTMAAMYLDGIAWWKLVLCYVGTSAWFCACWHAFITEADALSAES